MDNKDMVSWKNDGTDMTVERAQGEGALLDLRSQMNRLFDQFFERPFSLSPFFRESAMIGDFAPRLDVSETDEEVTISAELPGLEPEDINITVDRNCLNISGEKRAEKEDQGQHYCRVERSYGSFQRSIPLPDELDEDKIDATYKRGVLKVTVPKKAEYKRQSKRIEIKGD
jgi:HSP20 family protein